MDKAGRSRVGKTGPTHGKVPEGVKTPDLMVQWVDSKAANVTGTESDGTSYEPGAALITEVCPFCG